MLKTRLRTLEKKLRPRKEVEPVRFVFRYGKQGAPKEPGVLRLDFGDNGEKQKEGK